MGVTAFVWKQFVYVLCGLGGIRMQISSSAYMHACIYLHRLRNAGLLWLVDWPFIRTSQ